MSTIALVDDDHNILTSVSIALEAEGYRVTTYQDGVSALDGFRTSPPDLAILDIKMPRMDGMETLRRLRQKSDLPVIFLTSKEERGPLRMDPERAPGFRAVRMLRRPATGLAKNIVHEAGENEIVLSFKVVEQCVAIHKGNIL